MVKLLIARGADVNLQDTFYQMRAIDMAMMNKHSAVVTLLLERGSKGAPAVLPQAIQAGNMALVGAVLQSAELTRAHVRPALAGAKKVNNPEIMALIEKKSRRIRRKTRHRPRSPSIARCYSPMSAAIATRKRARPSRSR